MAYETLKSDIQGYVRQNGEGAITGDGLQSILLEIVNTLGTGYKYVGVATPSTSPGTPTETVFYIGGAGTYANFGTTVNVAQGQIAVFKYNNGWSADTLITVVGEGGVSTSMIAASAVTNAKINDGAVGTSKLGANAVTTAKIADNAVETAKIKDGNVTTAKIADANITTAKIADKAVTKGKIADAVNADVDWAVAAQKMYQCTTEGSTAAKEVTASGWDLRGGGSIKIRFAYANTASSPTLNINGTGAKAMMLGSSSVSADYSWADNQVVEFTYYPLGNVYLGHLVSLDKVSVSQNTSTGHTDINIGGTTTSVPSVEEVNQVEQKAKYINYFNLENELKSCLNLTQTQIEGLAKIPQCLLSIAVSKNYSFEGTMYLKYCGKRKNRDSVKIEIIDGNGNTIDYYNSLTEETGSGFKLVESHDRIFKFLIDIRIAYALDDHTGDGNWYDYGTTLPLSLDSIKNTQLSQFLTKVDIESGKSLIDSTFASDISYSEEREFIYIVKDSQNRILFGIKKEDGTMYFGAGVPSQIMHSIDSLHQEVLQDIEDFKEEIEEEIEEIVGDGGIVDLNPAAKNLLPNLKYKYDYRIVVNDILSIAFLSDIHGSEVNLKRYMDFCNHYSSYIDLLINGGDTVTNTFDNYTDIIAPAGAQKLMNCIGNHDVAHSGDSIDWDYYRETTERRLLVYNAFIGNYINQWGTVVQPDDAATEGLCYFYKDDSASKTRTIFLDCTDMNSAQITWLNNALNDTLDSENVAYGFSVIIVYHYIPGESSTITYFDCPFTSVIDATVFIQYSAALISAVDEFIHQGGKFVTYLVGHSHKDYSGFITSTNGKQLFVGIATASYGSSAKDSVRTINQKSQDCFDIIGIDTNLTILKILRIGCDTDLTLRQKETLAINYSECSIIN